MTYQGSRIMSKSQPHGCKEKIVYRSLLLVTKKGRWMVY